MKPIKYAILLLVAVTALSGAVEAKKIVTRRRTSSKSTAQRKREEQQREKRAREQREREAKARRKRAEQIAANRKKRKAAAEATEKDRLDKMKAARLEREEKAAAAEKTAREEKAMLGEYDTMATEVKMSSVQRAKLVALVKKLRVGNTTGSGGNQAEIARLTKAYNEATGARKGIIAEALKKARKKNAGDVGGSRADQHRKIMGLLTDAQKLKWGGYKLSKNPALKFERITLTEKQIKRIRATCNASAKDLPDETAAVAPKAAAKVRKSVLQEVRLQIIFEVLTPEQRAAVQRADAKKRAAAADGK